MRVKSRLCILLEVAIAIPYLSAQSTGIVISQIYGGGGNSGATLALATAAQRFTHASPFRPKRIWF